MQPAIILALGMSCYGLPPDMQAYCQARYHANQAYCHSITDADTRAACRAEISGGAEVCLAITDAFKRQECRNRALKK